jgi:type I restriction enzyme, S subunit
MWQGYWRALMPKVGSFATIVRLDSVCLSVTDGKHGDCENEEGSGYYFLSAKDVRDGKLQYDGARQITESDFVDTHKRTRLEPLDILISNSGTIGRIAIAPEVPLTHRTTFQKSVAILKPNQERVDPHYLLYYLLSAKNRLISAAGGTAQVNLLLRDLRSFDVTLYPLDLQRKIASILSAYDDLIENNTRRIMILAQMAQVIYREWFVEFRAPGVKLRKTTSDEQKVTGKDRFPVGWELKQLGDIAQEVRRGVQPDQIDSETPYFGLEHLPRKSIALSDWGTASQVQSTKLAFKKGEILFGKIRPYFHKVGVAPVDGVCSSDTIVIVPKSAEYFALTLACVSSEDFVTQATQTSQGTKMPRANWDVLTKYPVAMPPEPLLKQFNALIQDFVDLIINMVFRNRNLRQTRDLLLPRLVGGEVAINGL